jgi:hypothetical protein
MTAAEIVPGRGPSLLVIEAGISLIAFTLALMWPRLGSGALERAERFFSRLARRPGLCVFSVGLAAIGLRLAILPLLPVPEPFVHDEFANLLAADTFASGRVTNPTHPLWIYFESFHITQLPTYMSMYFPAQGLVLAAGKILTGNPWFGMCLAGGFLCASLCWALQGWLPPSWALFGGLMAILRLDLFSYWVNSYYGGAIASIGGSLVLGALVRMVPPPLLFRRRPERRNPGAARYGLWLALGLAILANSRPWEGFWLSLPAAFVLGRATLRAGSAKSILRHAAAPALLLCVAAGLSAWYNHRVFGSAFTLPYQVNRAAYASAPVFLWQPPRPIPVYRYKTMRDFYTRWELRDYLSARAPSGFFRRTAQKAGTLLFFLFGFALLPPLIMLGRVWRDRRTRYLCVSGLIFAFGLGVNVWLFPHYVAPFIAGVYAILLQAMRHLRVWKPGGEPRGKALVRVIPLVCVALAAIRLFAAPLGIDIPRWPSMWYGTKPLGLARAKVVAQLESLPGPQLAIVRYSPRHEPFDDWVYNAADIDRSKVVWARESESGDENPGAALLKYFCNRQTWLVEPDYDPPRIQPYPR